jgi:hypothetical protein
MGRLVGGLQNGIVGLIVAACATTPLPGLTPTPIAPTEQPTLAGTPSESVNPSTAATPTIRALGPAPTPNSDLHVGGMATVVRDGVRRWADPAARAAGHDYPRLGAGTLVYLVDGPRVLDGIEYWQVWPSASEGESLGSPLGWTPSRLANGEPVLEPHRPACPPYSRPFTASDLASLTELEQLTCFGASEIVLHGTVDCTRPIVDGYVGGAPYMESNRACRVGGFPVQGSGVYRLLDEPKPVEEVRGFYEVRGHFDDPGAMQCHSIPDGTSLELEGEPDPGAVMICRSDFVATSATPAVGYDPASVGRFESGDLVTVVGGAVFGLREQPSSDEPAGVWLYEGAGPYLVDRGGFLGNYDFWYLWDQHDLLGTFSDAEQHQGGWLMPVALECPSAEGVLDAASVIALTGIERIACFGDREITLRGDLYCFFGVGDGGPGGAPWISAYEFCELDRGLPIYGEAVTNLITNMYEDVHAEVIATGHFDDPAARGCRMRPIGVDEIEPRFPRDPRAVMQCRQMFVATSVTVLE